MRTAPDQPRPQRPAWPRGATTAEHPPRRSAGAIAALAVALTLALPGAAQAASHAECVANWRDTITPGISLTPSDGTFTSHGQTGSIICLGSVNGHRVTGPGTFGEDGVAHGTCALATGSALFSMTIPTTGGAVRLQIPARFTIAGVIGLRPTGTFPGGFVFAPLTGNCVTSPITKVAVVLHGTLTT